MKKNNKNNKNKNNNTMLVFTYGTLMRGNGNNYLLGDAKFICTARINGFKNYGMPYNFPCVVQSDNENDYVIGEVWEVEINQLDTLDWLEGYDRFSKSGMYLRRNNFAYQIDNNKKYPVSYYLWNEEIPLDSVRVPNGKKWNRNNSY